MPNPSQSHSSASVSGVSHVTSHSVSVCFCRSSRMSAKCQVKCRQSGGQGFGGRVQTRVRHLLFFLTRLPLLAFFSGPPHPYSGPAIMTCDAPPINQPCNIISHSFIPSPFANRSISSSLLTTNSYLLLPRFQRESLFGHVTNCPNHGLRFPSFVFLSSYARKNTRKSCTGRTTSYEELYFYMEHNLTDVLPSLTLMIPPIPPIPCLAKCRFVSSQVPPRHAVPRPCQYVVPRGFSASVLMLDPG